MAPRIALPTCARCGAPLEVPPGEERPRCTYCGARSVVESVRVPRGPDPVQGGPRALANAARGPRGRGFALGLVAVLAAVGALTQWTRLPRKLEAEISPPARDAPATPAGHVAPKDGLRPGAQFPATVLGGLVLDDVDGDGVEDVVGVFENATPAHEPWLGALSGADGHEIWALGARDGVGDAGLEASLRAVVSGWLLVADSSGRVQSFQASNGAPNWTRTLAAPVRDLCAGANHAIFRLADGSQVALSLHTGEPLSTGPTGACDPVTTSRSDAPNFHVAVGPDAAAIAQPAVAQFVVARALVPSVGTARVLLGTDRATGWPAIAMVSAGKRVWETSLESDAARAAALVESERATVRYGHVVVAYPAEPADLRVACFDLASGSRNWDVTLHGEAATPDEDVAISRDHRVIVRTAAGRLHSLDLADGAERPVGAGAGAQSP